MYFLKREKAGGDIFNINAQNVDAERPQNVLHSNNPFDVNLIDTKEAILYSGPMHKFYFNEQSPFYSRFLVVTKSAVRVYENKQKALSTYGRPLIAIPLSAVLKVERTKYDVMREDIRFENIPPEDL